MAAFFLWCILFILCWPLALLAIVLFPIVWLLTLPFRIVGIAVHGIFALLARSAVFPSCTGFARSAGDLKTGAPAARGTFRVSPGELLIFLKKRLNMLPKRGGIASTHAVEISVETRSPAKCAISKRLRYFQPFCHARYVSLNFAVTYVYSAPVDR